MADAFLQRFRCGVVVDRQGGFESGDVDVCHHAVGVLVEEAGVFGVLFGRGDGERVGNAFAGHSGVVRVDPFEFCVVLAGRIDLHTLCVAGYEHVVAAFVPPVADKRIEQQKGPRYEDRDDGDALHRLAIHTVDPSLRFAVVGRLLGGLALATGVQPHRSGHQRDAEHSEQHRANATGGRQGGGAGVLDGHVVLPILGLVHGFGLAAGHCWWRTSSWGPRSVSGRPPAPWRPCPACRGGTGPNRISIRARC